MTKHVAFNKLQNEYLPALNTALPLYANVIRQELEAIHLAVDKGFELSTIYPSKSPTWILSAINESKKTETLADKWMMLDIDDFLNIPLAGLDDFSLAAYHTIALLREESPSTDSPKPHDKMNEAMRRIVKNTVGSALLDYNWLYGDIADYDVLDDDREHLHLLKVRIVHDLTYENGRNVMDNLLDLACNTIRCEKMTEGIHMLIQLIRNNPLNFKLFENAFHVFEGNGQYRAANMMISGARRVVSITGKNRHELDDLEFYATCNNDLHATDPSVPLPWERTLQTVIKKIPTQFHPTTVSKLARQLIGDLDSIPIKQMNFDPRQPINNSTPTQNSA